MQSLRLRAWRKVTETGNVRPIKFPIIHCNFGLLLPSY
jgi:hypothetical protein